MKDFTQKLKDNLQNISQNLKDGSEDVWQKVKDGANTVGNIGSNSVDKVADIINNLVDTLPLLEEAGYRADNFRINVALAPTVSISFNRFKKLNPEELGTIKTKYHDIKMFNLILKMLETADSLQAKINADDFSLHEVIVDVSLPPQVSLSYTRKTEKLSFNDFLDKE